MTTDVILSENPKANFFIYLFKIAFVAAIEFIYFCHISSADGARFEAMGTAWLSTYHALTPVAQTNRILILLESKIDQTQWYWVGLYLFSNLDKRVFHFY